MITATAILSVSALTHASLRSATIELAGAIKFSYDRAIMEKRIQRIGMDIDKGIWWLDYTEDQYSLAAERLRGKEGEKALDGQEIEEKVKDLDSFFDFDDGVEVKQAIEGGKAAQFVPDEEVGKPTPLPSGIRFGKVWTGHQEEPFTSGVAYLHFFKGGWSEPAQIELTDEDDYITLKVSPLTGRVRTYQKQLDDPEAEENDGREEGDE